MSRLIAYMGSDPERLRAALFGQQTLLQATPPATSEVIASCGIGFYQGGEVLLQKRPRLPPGPIDLCAALSDLHTDVFLAQVKLGLESRLAKNENTPPYRFRSWIFVHQGSTPGLERPREDLLGLIPDFLKRNIRGQTTSEQLFHLFLASLHEMGRGQMEDQNLPPELLLRAFQHSLGRLREVLQQAGADPDGGSLQVALTNGRALMALRRGPEPLWLRVIGPTLDGRDRGHDAFRGALVVSGADLARPDGFEEVPAEHAVLVGRDLIPRVTSL